MIDFVLNKSLVKEAKEFGFSEILSVKDIKAVEGKDDKVIRRALENKNTDMVYGVEKFRVKDKLHYKDSGLNQVLVKLAKKNKIKIGFCFNDILNSKSEERAIILGRMIVNIRLCNKYKVEMIFGSFANNKYELRDSRNLRDFGRLLGMNKIWNFSTDKFFKEDSLGIKRVK